MRIIDFLLKTVPVNKEKCIRYGVVSIIQSLFAFACSLLVLLYNNFSDSGLIITSIFVVFGIGIAGCVVLLINSLISFITQISCNRRAITWISLVIFLLSLIGSAIVIFVGLSVI